MLILTLSNKDCYKNIGVLIISDYLNGSNYLLKNYWASNLTETIQIIKHST